MVTLALFLLVLTLLLAGIGRVVRHPGLPFEVEPAFARYVVTGLVVIWQSGQARADALDRAGLHPGIHESGRPDQHRSISG